jgi:hypothetical protein
MDVLIIRDDEHNIQVSSVVDAFTNTDYRMWQYLSLFISDCQEIDR